MSLTRRSEEQNPLVSVIVASYNHREYVEQAIESIRSQTYSPIELLVIDDGSIDGSPELLVELSKRHDFKLVIRKNGGLISVLNTAVPMLEGEFIVFHASDDVSLPDRINRQVEVFKRYPNAAFISGNLCFVTEKSAELGTLLPVTGEMKELQFDDIFVQREKVSSVTTMYRRAALVDMPPLWEKYRAEDPQIFLKLTDMGYTWVQWAGPAILNYRLLETSQSRTVMDSLLRENLRLIDEYSSHPLYDEAYSKVRVSLFSTLAEIDKWQAILEIKKGRFSPFSAEFFRVIIKLLLPRSLHRIFKRAGKVPAVN